MRRPLLIMFIILALISCIYTNIKPLDKNEDNISVEIVGIVKDKIEKEKYHQYKVGDYLVNDYTRNINLKIGKVVRIYGKYKNLDNMNFDNFKYGRYIKSTGYNGMVYMSKYKYIGDNRFYSYIGKIKYYIKNTFIYLYKDKSDFVNSLILGTKEYLSYEENDMFNKSGTSHIIAISGLHIGIILGLMIFFIRGINNVFKLIFISVILSLYALIVGSSPSVIRAVLFVVILNMAVFVDKKKDGISSLSLIGIIFIINNPYCIYNISFQLSFLATLSIIYFYGCINEIIKSKLISITIASNILTLPIVYYIFKGIPIFSIISNMIVVPLMGVIIYLSVFSIFVFKINLYIAKFIAYFNRVLINFIYYVLNKIINIDFAYIEIDNPQFTYVVMYYVIVFIYMIYKELKVMKEQENELQGYYKEY